MSDSVLAYMRALSDLTPQEEFDVRFVQIVGKDLDGLGKMSEKIVPLYEEV